MSRDCVAWNWSSFQKGMQTLLDGASNQGNIIVPRETGRQLLTRAETVGWGYEAVISSYRLERPRGTRDRTPA